MVLLKRQGLFSESGVAVLVDPTIPLDVDEASSLLGAGCEAGDHNIMTIHRV